MYKANGSERIKNDLSLKQIYIPGINIHVHWLNPLLFKRKSK